MSVCVSVPRRIPTLLRGPGCNSGNGRVAPIAVHYWVGLQLMHWFRCYDNISRTRNISECLGWKLPRRGSAVWKSLLPTVYHWTLSNGNWQRVSSDNDERHATPLWRFSDFGAKTYLLIMVALCNMADHYIFMMWFVVVVLLLLLSFFPRLISAVGDWMSTILRHMVWS